MASTVRFELDALHASKFTQSPYLVAHTAGEAVLREVTSLWFDTPELDLLGKGVALRIDRERERRVQAVTLGNGTRARDATSEWHTDLVGDGPAPGVLPEGPARDLLLKPEVEARLAPVFTAPHMREERRLRLQRGGEARLVLETGTLNAGHQSEPFQLGALELLAGREAQLYQVAQRLHRECPFRLTDRDLAARGYALLAPAPPLSRKAPRVDLEPELTAGEAFRRIAKSCVEHLRANEACAIAGTDPEGVHQMRVASRRLRSAISVFREALPRVWSGRLARETRWLSGELAAAREWDVFLLETLAPLREAMAGEASLHRLADRGAAARERAYGTVRTALGDPRYARLLLDLSRAVAEGWEATAPVVATARQVLLERHEKALRAGSNLAQLDANGLHRLRIRLKQLRYAVEFFADLFPGKRPKKYATALADLQDCLGVLQDVAVTPPLLAPVIANGERDALAHAAGLVEGWQAAAAEIARGRLEKRYTRFTDRKRFWE